MNYRLFIALFVSIFIGCSTAMAQEATEKGTSVDNAVVITAPNESSGVRAEDEWIAKHHPDWKKSRQGVFSSGDKVFDRISYVTADGKTQTIYYDITSFFGKF